MKTSSRVIHPVTYLRILSALKTVRKAKDSGIISLWVYPDGAWYVGETPFYFDPRNKSYGICFLSELDTEEKIKKTAKSFLVEYQKEPASNETQAS